MKKVFSLRHAITVLLVIAFVVILTHFIGGASLFTQMDQPLYSGKENHFITLDQAAILVKNFRDSKVEGSIWGEYFGRDAILSIINQDNCVGMRIYYGQKDEGTKVLVLVGVNGSGGDMKEGLLAEVGFPCPPYCDSTKILGN
jgi:hypothetical protein